MLNRAIINEEKEVRRRGDIIPYEEDKKKSIHIFLKIYIIMQTAE